MKQTEHQAQCAIFKWAELQSGTMPELKLLFAVPNAGRRGVIHGRKMKMEGMKAGVPDMVLPVARGQWHGLFIELKMGKNKPTEKQLSWIMDLCGQGYRAEVCYGFEAAISLIKEYLTKPKQ